jgi:hypothetical protein
MTLIASGSEVVRVYRGIQLGWRPNALPNRPVGDRIAGCVVVSNAEIGEIWWLVGIATPVDIVP